MRPSAWASLRSSRSWPGQRVASNCTFSVYAQDALQFVQPPHGLCTAQAGARQVLQQAQPALGRASAQFGAAVLQLSQWRRRHHAAMAGQPAPLGFGLRQPGRWRRIRAITTVTPDQPPHRSCRDGPRRRNPSLGDRR
jgi:hypothetical protein